MLAEASMRRGFGALALLAVLSVIAQPICAALEIHAATAQAATVAFEHDAQQGPEDQGPCCAVIETGTIIAASTAAVCTAVPAIAAPFALPYRLVRIAPAQTASGAPPPPPLSYHARSARILR
jgi:hypothetical protein